MSHEEMRKHLEALYAALTDRVENLVPVKVIRGRMVMNQEGRRWIRLCDLVERSMCVLNDIVIERLLNTEEEESADQCETVTRGFGASPGGQEGSGEEG